MYDPNKLTCYYSDSKFWYAAVLDKWTEAVTECVFDTEEEARSWLDWNADGQRHIPARGGLRKICHMIRSNGYPKYKQTEGE